MPKVLINGVAYSWSQVKINILGRQVIGVSKISYSDKEDMQDNYGAGNLPVSRSYGKISCEASIELYMEEIEAIQKASPTGRLQDVPEFNVVVSYQPQLGRIVNHTLHNARFKENGREVGNEDMVVKTEIPLLISHISWK